VRRPADVAVLGLLLTGLSAPAARAQRPEYVSPSGVAYFAQNDTGPVARAEGALAREPRDPERILQLERAQAAVRRFREAIETLTRGIVANPADARLYVDRGHREISVRELGPAEADLRRAAALDSSLYDAWFHLGVLRFVQGDFAEAARDFTRARPLVPNEEERAGSADWLWMSLMRAGRRAEAAAVLGTVPDSFGAPARYPYVLRLRLYQGRIPPDDLIGPADTGDVQLATLAYGLGDWYLVAGDTVRARTCFARSVASGGWPAFGFIASEAELRRLR